MTSAFPAKIWERRAYDRSRLTELTEALRLPEPIAAILLQRGLEAPEEAAAFLAPSLGHLPSPWLMAGMEKAVDILTAAVRQRQSVLVYGDYDVDGTTGTAVLALFLQKAGVAVHCRQPHRLHEGYGLHAGQLAELRRATGAEVLVTVDCGISDHQAVQAAREAGLAVIVTDHHQPPPQLPPADAVLNPRQAGCRFPDKQLAGVGVAFYLVMGLRSRLHEEGFWAGGEVPNLKTYLDLVALGTICDIVPLTGTNRILTKAGLEVLAATARPGLRRLLEVVNTTGTLPTAEDVGFRLGPRLNAAGRLGEAGRALELLMTEDDAQARRLASELDAENRSRQQLEKNLFEEALCQAERQAGQSRKTLVLAAEGWHRGILGIVASRVMHRFYRPTILLSLENGLAQGSGRSVPEVDLYGALAACRELLAGYGGHPNAAGLSLRQEELPRFSERFEEVVATALGPQPLQPRLLVDWPGETGLATSSFFEHYLRLAPFGQGNPEPVFSQAGCRLAAPRSMGRNGAHLRFGCSCNGAVLGGVGFGFGQLAPYLSDTPVDLAFTFQLNEFRGRQEWQIRALDIRGEFDDPGIS